MSRSIQLMKNIKLFNLQCTKAKFHQDFGFGKIIEVSYHEQNPLLTMFVLYVAFGAILIGAGLITLTNKG